MERELTIIEIENKIKGIRLQLAKLKKKYAALPRPVELKLTDENIRPLQDQLKIYGNMLGWAKY